MKNLILSSVAAIALTAGAAHAQMTVTLHPGEVKTGGRCTGFFLDGVLYAVPTEPPVGQTTQPVNPAMANQLVVAAALSQTIIFYPGPAIGDKLCLAVYNPSGSYILLDGVN